MRKIVVNGCFGGFALSDWACEQLGLAKYSERELPRDDKNLVELVERDARKASGMCSDLRIVEIPEDVAWEITEYDGMEYVAETHRRWYPK